MHVMSLFNIESNIKSKWEGKLVEIREITEKIWSQPLNASFTDHGIRHSERCTNYIIDIFNSLFSEPDVGLFEGERIIRSRKIMRLFSPRSFNIGFSTQPPLPLQKLAAKVAFALEASTYLHDIGMQCTIDLLHKKCGFSIKNSPGHYTKADLKKIRDWHHELSALWLEDAFFSSTDPRLSSTDPRLSFRARLRNQISDIDEPDLFH